MKMIVHRENRSFIANFMVRLSCAFILVLCFVLNARAGGPEYVAGSSYFDPSVMGQPLTWSQGQINYYTDQGNLSPILSNSAANAFVASAFLQWTSVTTAAVTATASGELAEDVNGSNIQVGPGGVVTAPADITPSATQTPVGIVYDFDGTVTDALLGEGAGAPSQCFWNAVYAGVDNFAPTANFLHALVVINGQCALESSQLTDVEYRLVRVLGQVLGMGWSQLNPNVVTGNPPPTPADFAGFPVMHYMDSVNCVPITVCYTNPYQLASDDIAALSRLYPPSSGPPSSTARIYGTVYFIDHVGAEAQAMEGVNIFARWIDPTTGLPSHQYSASSVSGFLFTGNAGNPITGLANPLGVLYSEFGSDETTVEGFFDLGGLPIPNGASTAQYQLSVEAVDPLWSAGVGPYTDFQVAPSGVLNPITVTVSAGGQFEQDINMTGSAQAIPSWAATETWSSPAHVLPAGDWIGSLSGYGDEAYFQVTAQANRTLSVAVTALDENSLPTETKAAPVVGIWTLGDPQGTPPPTYTPGAFNSGSFGMSLLSSEVLGSNSFIIGISDIRGDGRPDYAYHAHVLYGDSATPSRLPTTGGAVTLQGIGLEPSQVVTVGSANASLLASNASQLLVNAAGQNDGPQTITITDPISGAFSTMSNVVTFGASATDQILLLQGKNPPTPVGIQATYPVMVRVVQSDGLTPVNGATVGWSATNGVALGACGGASSCSVSSDETGMASTLVTPSVAGVGTVTATLAPGVYSPPQSVSGTLLATASSLAIGATTPYFWIAQGASLSVPLTVRVASNGVPQNNVAVNFIVVQGSGSLSASNANTNSAGYATVTLSVTNLIANVQISACVAQGGTPCTTINATTIVPSQLQAVSGASQVVSGTVFQPLIVRVTDSASPPDPVLGASVLFQSTVLRPAGGNLVSGSQSGMPTILSESSTTVQSDINGLASIVPSLSPFTGQLEVEVQISAGTAPSLLDQLESFPP
jgi:hypothetical protein